MSIDRLEQIGREITARVSKLDHLGGKAVDMYDSINCLLKEAEGLCDADGFAAFKQTYCPELGQSRTYELLAVQQGRKTVEEIREDTRLRVAKHRVKKKAAVTESDSVTLNGQAVDLDKLGPAAQAQITQAGATTKEIEDETAEASAEQRKAPYAATENDSDPFAVETDGDPYDQVVALPWFASEIKPIYEGKVQIDTAKSASALSQFKKTCQELLPQMTTKDLRMAQCILGAVGEIECEVETAIKEAEAAAANAKRIKREAKNPEKAKEKAREEAQDEAMQDGYEEAKAEARESGETWSDIKDEWIEDWIANNWGPEEEAEFEAEFKDQWIADHGTAFPEPEKAAA